MTKLCSVCKIEKLMEEYYSSGKRPYSSRCKECSKALVRDYQKTDKAKEWWKEYRKGEVYKKAIKVYQASEKGRIVDRRKNYKRYWADPVFSRMKRKARKHKCKIDLLQEILERDLMCIHCWTRDNLSFDHIIPISKGGKTEYNNLQILCCSCNSSKGAR